MLSSPAHTGPGPTLTLTLRCDDGAPAEVRGALRQIDAGPIVGDAMVVASELVSNAVRHSGCTSHDPLDVRVSVDDVRLRVEVIDHGRSDSQPALAAGEDPFGHIGLRIVEAVADRWGSDRIPGGHKVWAELSLA